MNGLDYGRSRTLMPQGNVRTRTRSWDRLPVQRRAQLAQARWGVAAVVKRPVAANPSRGLPKPIGREERRPDRFLDVQRDFGDADPVVVCVARIRAADHLPPEVARPERSESRGRLEVVCLSSSAGPVEAAAILLAIV